MELAAPVLNKRVFPLSIFPRGLGKALAIPFLLVPIAITSCSSPNPSGGNVKSSNAELNKKQSPATDDDIFLYRGIGASFLCNARTAEVEFPKAVGIAAATYAQVLNGRHGGIVASAGDKKLTSKQLFAGAEFQVITGALQYCPDQVPDEVKEKVQTAIDKQGNTN